MPKTSIYKQCDPFRWKNKIRPSNKSRFTTPTFDMVGTKKGKKL